jgi:hypothetical protein
VEAVVMWLGSVLFLSSALFCLRTLLSSTTSFEESLSKNQVTSPHLKRNEHVTKLFVLKGIQLKTTYKASISEKRSSATCQTLFGMNAVSIETNGM